MAKPKVAILGCTGMLGSMTLDYFVQSGDFEMAATARQIGELKSLKKTYPSVEFRQLDAEKAGVDEIKKSISGSVDL